MFVHICSTLLIRLSCIIEPADIAASSMVRQLRYFTLYFAAFLLISLVWSGTDGILEYVFAVVLAALALAWISPRALRWLRE